MDKGYTVMERNVISMRPTPSGRKSYGPQISRVTSVPSYGNKYQYPKYILHSQRKTEIHLPDPFALEKCDAQRNVLVKFPFKQVPVWHKDQQKIPVLAPKHRERLIKDHDMVMIPDETEVSFHKLNGEHPLGTMKESQCNENNNQDRYHYVQKVANEAMNQAMLSRIKPHYGQTWEYPGNSFQMATTDLRNQTVLQMAAARAAFAQPTYQLLHQSPGQLLKGRLKPLSTFKLPGPMFESCAGVRPAPNLGDPLRVETAGTGLTNKAKYHLVRNPIEVMDEFIQNTDDPFLRLPHVKNEFLRNRANMPTFSIRSSSRVSSASKKNNHLLNYKQDDYDDNMDLTEDGVADSINYLPDRPQGARDVFTDHFEAGSSSHPSPTSSIDSNNRSPRSPQAAVHDDFEQLQDLSINHQHDQGNNLHCHVKEFSDGKELFTQEPEINLHNEEVFYHEVVAYNHPTLTPIIEQDSRGTSITPFGGHLCTHPLLAASSAESDWEAGSTSSFQPESPALIHDSSILPQQSQDTQYLIKSIPSHGNTDESVMWSILDPKHCQIDNVSREASSIVNNMLADLSLEQNSQLSQ